MELLIQLSVLLAVFIVVLTAAIGIKRLVVHTYKVIFGVYEKERRSHEVQRQRLMNPRWDEYQRYLGREIPREFKDFYAMVAQRDPPEFKFDETRYLLFAIDQFDDTEKIAIAWSEYGDPVYFNRGCGVDNALYYFDGGDEVILMLDTSKSGIYSGC